jgi:hypothetical protein
MARKVDNIGNKTATVEAEMISIGWEVTKLMQEKGISYRQILIDTGIDRNGVLGVQEGNGYTMQTYLRLIKYLRHDIIFARTRKGVRLIGS